MLTSGLWPCMHAHACSPQSDEACCSCRLAGRSKVATHGAWHERLRAAPLAASAQQRLDLLLACVVHRPTAPLRAMQSTASTVHCTKAEESMYAIIGKHMW